MNTANVEIFLARLYCDEDFSSKFLQSPHEIIAAGDFTPQQQAELLAIEKSELILAIRSYKSKRETSVKL